MLKQQNLTEVLKACEGDFYPVVPYTANDKLLLMDFTQNNNGLTENVYTDTNHFTAYISSRLRATNSKFGIGGYAEHRIIYQRSALFNAVSENGYPTAEAEPEPRRLHLGIDIWGKPYTPVCAPLDGIVHSFSFQNFFGNYGAVIILSHRLEGVSFFTVYGHLSLNSVKNLNEGESIRQGDIFAEFGIPQENGSWPPHLHFQLIKDMEGLKGDYPGVCQLSEKEKYLSNCPDPDLILKMMQYAAPC
jgi:murein DD-endopeptidase MepM/ murein hydrolase activator NlpD